MKEDLLQYAWQYRLYDVSRLLTVDGEPISVINVGDLNRDAGPDFFNVKVKIGGTIWAGNVEVHVTASDWYKHHHDEDPRYDSVVLHVVERSDMRIRRANGDVIPQLERLYWFHGSMRPAIVSCPRPPWSSPRRYP